MLIAESSCQYHFLILYLISGDFNHSSIDWENVCFTSSTQVFIDTVQDLFMFKHIVRPTRYKGEDTPNVLELVFTDDENMVDNRSYLPE